MTTRRNFFLKASAALSLPLAAASEPSVAHDDMDSIRRLHQTLASAINDDTARASDLFADGNLPAALATVTRLQPADFGQHDTIEIAPDARTAHATFHCVIETRVPIAAEGTLIEMARAQGEGFIRSTSSRMLEFLYVRDADTWKIKTASFV